MLSMWGVVSTCWILLTFNNAALDSPYMCVSDPYSYSMLYLAKTTLCSATFWQQHQLPHPSSTRSTGSEMENHMLHVQYGLYKRAAPSLLWFAPSTSLSHGNLRTNGRCQMYPHLRNVKVTKRCIDALFGRRTILQRRYDTMKSCCS